jgi:ABC-type antimicrobial peptide transport system permease subunit
MACANLAGWLLARSVDRRHELGIRAALGADRWQLIRPVLFESTVTAMIGSAIGAVVAPWISAFLVLWCGRVAFP